MVYSADVQMHETTRSTPKHQHGSHSRDKRGGGGSPAQRKEQQGAAVVVADGGGDGAKNE